MDFDFSKIKKVHCIGIGGIAVSADAKFLLAMGKKVAGSDVTASEITKELKKMGVSIYIGHSAKNLYDDTELVIYSPAVSLENIERKKAKKLGIREMSHTEFMGFLSREFWTIAVSGTNGKSTTTAMLGLILEKAGVDPAVIVGSKVAAFEYGNLRINAKLREKEHEIARNFNYQRTVFRGKIPPNPPLKKGGTQGLFVVEGCEYKAGMLELSPKMIVLTNIEEDHLDFYKDLAHIKRTFKQYAKKVEKDGIVVYNMDDENSVCILEKFKGKKVGYGKVKSQKSKVKNNVLFENIAVKNQRQIFDVYQGDKELGEIKLRIPGTFNVYNALAAIAASLVLDVDFKIIKKSLEEFKGIWRRFEIVGKYKGAVIISDYAHHPTAVKNTIQAAREFYPNCRIVAVFQPHSHNRTLKLFTEFSESFNNADLVILSEIYDVEGRENPEDKISGRKLADAVKQCRRNEALPRSYNENDVFYAKDLKECGRILLKNIKKDDVVLIMGAGDVYKVVKSIKSIKSVKFICGTSSAIKI